MKEDLLEIGYVVVEDCLPDVLLNTLRGQRDQVLSALPTEHRETYRSQGSLVNLGDHPEFSHLIAHSALHSVMQDFGFKGIRWLAGYLISKPPHSPALFWHQDWWGWDHDLSYTERLLGLGAMIYLSDTCRQNGCLRVIPGSHRRRHRLHDLPVAHEQSLSSINDPDNIAYQSDAAEAAIEVNTGDLVLLDPRLLHSAYANQSDHERSLFTLWYLPEFSTLPEAIQARYVQIFNRHDLDTGDSSRGKLLDSWSSEHKNAIAHLEPRYDGPMQPHPWNRAPDQTRMIRPSD